MQNPKLALYTAVAYAFLLSFGAYLYCRLPQNTARIKLQNAEIESLKLMDTIILSDNYAISGIMKARKSKYKKLTPSHFDSMHAFCTKTKRILASLEMKIASQTFSKNDEKYAFLLTQTCYDTLKNSLSPYRQKDFEYSYTSNKNVAFFTKNPKILMQLLQNNISQVENRYLYFAFYDLFGSNCGGPADRYMLYPQLDSYTLHEGGRLKGTAIMGVIPYKYDTIYINKKPYATKRGIAQYTVPPQPAGKYKILVEKLYTITKNSDTDTSFLFRDTLYYNLP